MNTVTLIAEDFDTRYIAFVDHTEQAKILKRVNPQLARVYACLARAARNLLSQDVRAGVVRHRINGTSMRMDPVSADESHCQFRTRMQQVPLHISDKAVDHDFASAVMQMFTDSGVNIIELPTKPDGTRKFRIAEV